MHRLRILLSDFFACEHTHTHIYNKSRRLVKTLGVLRSSYATHPLLVRTQTNKHTHAHALTATNMLKVPFGLSKVRVSYLAGANSVVKAWGEKIQLHSRKMWPTVKLTFKENMTYGTNTYTCTHIHTHTHTHIYIYGLWGYITNHD